jgi:histone deacetylase complex regulatory component SIN3
VRVVPFQRESSRLVFSIDTPAAIQRVLRLFHGNRVLIQGFNTFLPVGYRIYVSESPADPNTITVTTPMGTTTQNTDDFSAVFAHQPQASTYYNLIIASF